jgi:hypothetical protein
MTFINSIFMQRRREIDFECIKKDLVGSGRGVFQDIIPELKKTTKDIRIITSGSPENKAAAVLLTKPQS